MPPEATAPTKLNVDWRGLLGGLMKFVSEEMAEPEHQAGKPIAAGIVYCCRPEGQPLKILLVKRSVDEPNYAGYWSIPGGGIDEGETPEQAARRESAEEVGKEPDGLKLLKTTKLPLGDEHVTFKADSLDEFTPRLNAEHSEFGWFRLDEVPKPLHPGVKEVLDEMQASLDEVAADQWYVLAADADEPLGPFLAQDEAQAAARGWEAEGMAYDRMTVRTIDSNGYLHVDVSHISKATVSPYQGSEVPGWKELGLDGGKIYYMLRDPQELAKAADKFNNLPLLSKHVPVSAEKPPKALAVGSTGTDSSFVNGYLDNSLVVWEQAAIDLIASDKQKELSCAYRYKPDMRPGVWKGMKYDGVMRNIEGNHVALVETGRAGHDVVVGDEKPKETTMAKAAVKIAPLTRTGLRLQTALYTRLLPLMAQDAKLDLAPALKGVNMGNYKGKLPTIVKMALDAANPLMTSEATAAGGAGPDDVIIKLLDMVGGQAAAPDPEAPEMDAVPEVPGAGAPAAAATVAAPAAPDPNAAVMDFLKGCGLDEASMAKVAELMGAKKEPAAAATDPAKPKPATEDEDDEDMPITPQAMDSAIKAATAAERKNQKDLYEAHELVKPYVGNLPMTFDSAPDVIRTALKMKGVKVDGLHDDALRPILEAQQKIGQKPRQAADSTVAMDSARSTSFAERFKGAANINHM